MKQLISEVTNEAAKLWVKFYKKNIYYHSCVHKLTANLIPQDASVVEFGSRSGELLRSLHNKEKIGVETNSQYINLSKRYHKKSVILNDKTFWKKYGKKKFDVVLLNNNLSETEDIQRFISRLKNITTPDSRIIVLFFNYFWKPILDITQVVGLRMPYFKQPNWLSTNDLEGVFALENMEKVKSGKSILAPVHILFLSDLINRYISVLPLISQFTLLNYLVLRKQRPERQYSTSIIIPVRNEEKNVTGILKKIPKFGKQQEVIFVEGHSKDKTYEVIGKEVKNYEGWLHPALYKQKGRGKADAVRLGFEKAKNEVLMILDGDLTINPKELSKFYRALVQGKGELIMGSRLIYPMENQAMRTLNILGNKIFSSLFTFILNQKVKDTLCGTKVLFKKDYERIKKIRRYFGEIDPFGDFELIFGAARLNLKILEIPVKYKQRAYGETNIKRFSHGILLLRMVIIAFNKLKFIK